ncbi:unnamed protein product [Closterium sp. NIES-53]
MQEVVDRDLRVVPPLVLRGEGVGIKEGEEKGGTMDPQMVQKGEGLRLQFDVALHIRGHAVNVEGDYCISKDKKCQEKAQKGEQVRAHAYMKPRQWRCIARLMQFLRVKKAAAGGFTNATAAAGRPPNATTAAGGFNNATAAADGSANATAAADGSANATGDNFGIFDGKASHASANAANKTSKASTEHTRLLEYPQKSAIVGTKKEKRRNLQQRSGSILRRTAPLGPTAGLDLPELPELHILPCPNSAPHAALPALPHALCPARRTARCCLARNLHAALLVLCPALRSACTLPCTGACAPPCPAANAPSCPAARASPCPAAPAPPYLAARAPPYPAAFALPCPAACTPCSPRAALPCSPCTALPLLGLLLLLQLQLQQSFLTPLRHCS